MRTARVFVLAGAAGLLLPGTLTGCAKKQPESTTPATASEPAAPPAAPKVDPMADAERANPVEKVEVLASFEGIEDMIKTASNLQAKIEGEEPSGDPMAEIQAGLLAQGFGPGFLSSINLDALHAVKVAFPTDDAAGPEAIDFAASLAVSDARKVLESMPSAARPQPLGGDMWELRQENEAFLIKETGTALLWGRSDADVEKAGGLLQEVGKGRRVRIKAWNIPADQVNPAELLDLPQDIPIVKTASEILQELNAAEFQLDLGSGKQVEVVASAEAPFGKLGLDPLGKARMKATPLEAKLPEGAIFVTTLAYGDPKMLHKTIDKMVPVDQVPAPFDEMVKDAVKGVHMILNSIAGNVVAALYLDGKGQPTIVIAAGVKKKKQDKAIEGLRKIHGTVKLALDAHAALQGKNKDAKFAVNWKESGLKMSGVKADQMTVKIAKDFQGETEEVALFLKKNSIETVSFVEDGVAFWAIGAGARSLGSDVARSLGKDRSSSMASEGTLETVRKGMDGCQVCMSFDAGAYLRLRLLDMQAKTKDKAQLKVIKKKLAELKKLKGEAEVGMGVRFAENEGAVGFVVPTATLELSKETVASMKDLLEFVDSPDVAMAESVQAKGTK
ncbi:MAG: hypothetical protein AAGA54_20415 [Myxococcota bacterium]